MMPGQHIGKNVSMESLIDLWKKGNRRQVARYVKTRRMSDAIRIALQLAEKTGMENAWRLVATLDALSSRSLANY